MYKVILIHYHHTYLLFFFFSSKDPRLRCVKQKSIDFLTNVSIISEIARSILDQHSQFLIQLIQGIRDGHLIEEKIPSLSLLLRLSKVIIEKNLLNSYQHLIDMQLIDILIDIFQNEQYKSNDYMIYFIKFESFALQCLHMILQSVEHVDMWSESMYLWITVSDMGHYFRDPTRTDPTRDLG